MNGLRTSDPISYVDQEVSGALYSNPPSVTSLCASHMSQYDQSELEKKIESQDEKIKSLESILRGQQNDSKCIEIDFESQQKDIMAIKNDIIQLKDQFLCAEAKIDLLTQDVRNTNSMLEEIKRILVSRNQI